MSSVAPSLNSFFLSGQDGVGAAVSPGSAFTLDGMDVDRLYLCLKRALDVTVALTLLLLLLPVMLLLAVAVKLDSPGPVFYRQRRIGKDGAAVEILKFRSMRTTVAAPCRVYKAKGDPRVTRLGRFIRAASLDELPQLLNVLRGDMSLVGPRPELTEMLAYYRAEHYRRHLATPGLTGWWQINGRIARGTRFSPEEDLQLKLANDLYYLEHRSFWLDLRILLLTIPVVLGGRGAF